MAKLSLKHVYKVYEGNVRAVNDYNLEIKDKEFVVFVGPSGCGKSTTLRMIAGLENITSGELYIDDALVNDVESKERDIAMVFQSYALYPHMTVFQNMAFGLKIRRMDPKEIEERVKKAAEVLDITELLDRKPKALSGGQRQRVALGRAIVREPKVFLLDEPLSNLDAKLRVQMRTEITKLHQRLQTTFIYVTHDQTEAMTMGDRIVVMKLGYIQQVDTPVNLYENPANLFVATFLGSPQMNILKATLVGEGGELFAKVGEHKFAFPEDKKKQLADKSYIGKEVYFGVRPEHLILNKKEGVPVTVDVVEQLGDQTIAYCKMEGRDETIIVKSAFDGSIESGSNFLLKANMLESHLFDVESEMSIMGVPQENRFEVVEKGNALELGEQTIELPEEYANRVLALDREKLLMSFAVDKVEHEAQPGYFPLKGKVDFLLRRTGEQIVYLSLPGVEKHLVYTVGRKEKVVQGEGKTVYVPYDGLMLSDENGNHLTVKDNAMPNVVKAAIKEKNGMSEVSFGHNKVVVPSLGVVDGVHDILLKEDKVTPIYKKKEYKKILNQSMPEVDKKRLIKVSAYDEDPLGEKNAIFVKVSGMEHYATFVVPAEVSVYKIPVFQLYLEDGAIEVL